jgi:hypothetical protein
MLDPDRLTTCLHEVVKHAGGQVPQEKVMDIVSMAYEARELSGEALTHYIARLVKLTT